MKTISGPSFTTPPREEGEGSGLRQVLEGRNPSTIAPVVVRVRLPPLSLAAYHAGLADRLRSEVQRRWMEGETKVRCTWNGR